MFLLVEISYEQDRRVILRYAYRLKNMQAEWPKVSIASAKAKRQQEQHRQLRNDCAARCAAWQERHNRI